MPVRRVNLISSMFDAAITARFRQRRRIGIRPRGVAFLARADAMRTLAAGARFALAWVESASADQLRAGFPAALADGGTAGFPVRLRPSWRQISARGVSCLRRARRSTGDGCCGSALRASSAGAGFNLGVSYPGCGHGSGGQLLSGRIPLVQRGMNWGDGWKTRSGTQLEIAHHATDKRT